MRRLRPRAADILLPCGSQREGQEVKSGLRSAALGLPFLLRLELLAEDRSYFTLHESPWHCRICQRAFIPTWTVYLWTTKQFVNNYDIEKKKDIY